MENPMKQCARCGQPYEDVRPFCLKCEGYEAIAYVSFGNYIAVTYKKKEQAVPTMWRDRE